MGEMAKKISNTDSAELLNILNIAYSEEWLSYYQYWLGAQLAEGPMRKAIAAEFLEHAAQELSHAQKLSDRILELGGVPALSPKDWEKCAICKYEAPKKTYVLNLLKQNILSERCAISRYQNICNLTFGKDYGTFALSSSILKDELEHEEDLESYQKDINAGIRYQNRLEK